MNDKLEKNDVVETLQKKVTQNVYENRSIRLGRLELHQQTLNGVVTETLLRHWPTYKPLHPGGYDGRDVIKLTPEEVRQLRDILNAYP